jgi:hypothetical protein
MKVEMEHTPDVNIAKEIAFDHLYDDPKYDDTFAQIETPNMPDRQPWVERLAQFHWSHEEISNGVAWNHMKKWAKK